MNTPPGGHHDQDEDRDQLAWNRRARGETPTQRLDRHWSDLLQELRVVQTGVQLLTGFLLTLPFQSRFAELDQFAHTVYLVAVGCAVASTCFLVAPVSLHRVLYERRARQTTVGVSHRLSIFGILMLGAALTGVVLLIFDVMVNRTVGWVAAAATLVLIAGLWLVLPLALRRQPHE